MVQATATRTRVVTEVIDADGHLFERDDDIRPYLERKWQETGPSYFFPTLDGWRRHGRGVGAPDDAQGWLRFLDAAQIQRTVIYPTAALGLGFSKEPEWSTALCHAYNSFFYEHYLKVDPRLQGVAIVPVQDPAAAARELRRAVEELGMVGAVLPAVGLRRPYGDAAFDPLYAAADSLGTVLAIHGAPKQGIGLEIFDEAMEGFVLAHPFSQMIQFTSMLSQRVFERFPRMKVVSLEAGCGWVPFLIDRVDRRLQDRVGRTIASEQLRDCPLYFHADLNELTLPAAIDVIGEDRLVYASDYPHEGVTAAGAAEEIQQFVEREDVSESAKRKILGENVKALYGWR